jgi:hypothetical protein
VRSFIGGNDYWLDMVELDFLEANLERYRELRSRTLEQQGVRNPEMPLHFARDEESAARAAGAPN